MGKPIIGTPVLRGEAAKEASAYIQNSRPDPAKQEQMKADLEFHRKVKVVKG